MPYPEDRVAPMRKELTDVGVRELLTAEEVDVFMSRDEGASLVLINSVCGCAAGSARPGLRMALQHDKVPSRKASVFAGQDLEAVSRLRSYIDFIPPSSPSLALFKEGRLVDFVPRHMIEGHSPESVAGELIRIFDRHC